MAGELLDKPIGMQEKNDDGAWDEESTARREADGNGYSEENRRNRISPPNDEYVC